MKAHMTRSTLLVLGMGLVVVMAADAVFAGPLMNSAVSRWRFGQPPAAPPGFNLRDHNGPELSNLGQLFLDENVDISGFPVNAVNSNGRALREPAVGGGFGFVFGDINDPPGTQELRIQGSMTMWARVLHPGYVGIDDIWRVGQSFFEAGDTYALELDEGKARFMVGDGNLSELTVTHGTVLAPGKFYDIAGVFDAGLAATADGTMTVYVFDPETGLQVGVPAVLGGLAIEEPFNYFLIDGNGDQNGLFFEAPNNANGLNAGALMEQSAVWDRALKISRVERLSAIPEPASLMLLTAIGGGSLLMRRRRRA